MNSVFMFVKEMDQNWTGTLEVWLQMHLKELCLFAAKPPHIKESILISRACISYRDSSGMCWAVWFTTRKAETVRAAGVAHCILRQLEHGHETPLPAPTSRTSLVLGFNSPLHVLTWKLVPEWHQLLNQVQLQTAEEWIWFVRLV